MSTYVDLHCKTHDTHFGPELKLCSIEELRQFWSGRYLIHLLYQRCENIEIERFGSTLHEIAEHRNCDVIIIDEYGREYSIAPTPPPSP